MMQTEPLIRRTTLRRRMQADLLVHVRHQQGRSARRRRTTPLDGVKQHGRSCCLTKECYPWVFVVAVRFRCAEALGEAPQVWSRFGVLRGKSLLSARPAGRDYRPVARRLHSSFRQIRGGRLWACGRRLRRWATQSRSGALSTVAAGAPQAHRPHVHGLPGAKRPAPLGIA